MKNQLNALRFLSEATQQTVVAFQVRELGIESTHLKA